MGEMCFKCKKYTERKDIFSTFAPLCETCYEELLNTYKEIKVYRFISPNVFFDILKNKELMFSLPSRWSDSFEDIFFKVFLDARKAHLYDPIFIREMLATRDTYYCQCWSLTPESQFFWEMYGYDGNAIRIEINLIDAFKMGIRIEPVIYAPILSKSEWIKRKEQFGIKFAQGNESDIYQVDEDGYYTGDFSKKTADMRYVDYILGNMWGIHDPIYQLEKIPIPKIIATKQPQFMIENEVRLFIDAVSLHDFESIYYKKYSEYVGRVYSYYNMEDADFDTHMPEWKSFSYKHNNDFIKSVMCHPNMSDNVFEQVYEQIKKNNLCDIFKGRSKIYRERI